MSKISIAMAIYNGEKYIKKQLDSILCQTMLPDEVIIVDDCSSDKTVDIVNDYIKEKSLKNWKFVINECNLGFKENFKKAISLTNGDICFLCDQDDIWCNEKIEYVISLFKSSEVIGVSTGFYVIDEFDNDITDKYLKKGNYSFGNKSFKKSINKIPLKGIMRRNLSPGCTCAYRRSAIDIFLKNFDGSIPHDYQLSTISSALSGYYYCNVPLNKYRIHLENTLGVKPVEQSREKIAEEKLKLSKVISDTGKEGKRLYDLCHKRYDFIKNKKTLEVLSLWINPEYRKYYSLKERIGDILYVFRK